LFSGILPWYFTSEYTLLSQYPPSIILPYPLKYIKYLKVYQSTELICAQKPLC
jgi:hypothetical protein